MMLLQLHLDFAFASILIYEIDLDRAMLILPEKNNWCNNFILGIVAKYNNPPSPPLKSSQNLEFSDNFRGNRTKLIRSNLL